MRQLPSLADRLRRHSPESIAARVRRAVGDALSVLSPVLCAGCGEADSAVCSGCVSQIAPEAVLIRRLEGGFPVWTAAEYAGPLRRVILALKNDQRTDVTRVLSAVIRRTIEVAARDLGERGVEGVVDLTLIPSSVRAYQRRGYHPVALMLRRAGLEVSPSLAYVRQPADQIGLGALGRRDNVAGALGAKRGVKARQFLLVDDVVTTGGTLLEGRRALTEAGATVVGAVCLARTDRRSSESGRRITTRG